MCIVVIPQNSGHEREAASNITELMANHSVSCHFLFANGLKLLCVSGQNAATAAN